MLERMKVASDFENAVRNAINQSIQGGVSPLLVLGLIEGIKLDVHANMKAAAAQAVAEMQRSQIVRSTTLPANGHQ